MSERPSVIVSAVFILTTALFVADTRGVGSVFCIGAAMGWLFALVVFGTSARIGGPAPG